MANNDNHSTPLVSIVVPVYNAEDYVKETIDSILSQDYENIELIIIDDGSKDSSPTILKSYESKAKIIHQENAGQANSLNRGWKIANGDILAYLSADDILYPDAVSKTVEAFLSSSKPDITLPSYDIIDSNSTFIKKISQSAFSYNRLFQLLINPFGPAAFFKKDVFRATGGWDPNLRQMPDLDFWLKATKGKKIEVIPSSISGYRIHPQSQTYSIQDETRSDEPMVVVENLKKHIEKDLWHLYGNRTTASALLLSAQYHMRSNRLRKGLSRVILAVSKWPMLILKIYFFRVLINSLLSISYYKLRGVLGSRGKK